MGNHERPSNQFKSNLTMLTDFYELTMANGYFENGFENTVAYFDIFSQGTRRRRLCHHGGVQQVVDYLENLAFTKEDVEFLRNKGIFSEAFWST